MLQKTDTILKKPKKCDNFNSLYNVFGHVKESNICIMNSLARDIVSDENFVICCGMCVTRNTKHDKLWENAQLSSEIHLLYVTAIVNYA